MLSSFFLLSRLSRSNPFRRVLLPHYHIHYTSLYHRPSSSHGALEIEFMRRASNSIAFYTAIADAVYSYPDVNTIIFKNLTAIGSPDSTFNNFYFKCIDLSEPLLANTPYLEFWIEQLALPADIIVLPRDLKRIMIPSNCGTLKDVYITSPVPIPIYCSDVLNAQSPIRALHGLTFHVPEVLLPEYLQSAVWNGLAFIDERDNAFRPEIRSYTCL